MKSILIRLTDTFINILVIVNDNNHSISTLSPNRLEQVILYLMDLRDYLVTGY
jgi:hypothetical protein